MGRKKRVGGAVRGAPKLKKFKLIIFAILVVLGIVIFKENQKVIVCLDAGHGGHDVRVCFK